MTDPPAYSEGAHRLLSGLIAATFTPMTSTGEVDLGVIPRVTEFVLGQGVSGLFVGGSTGEAPSLRMDERRAVAEAYLQAVRALAPAKPTPVIIQVGHNCLRSSERLAAHAEALGADAIAFVPPSYFPVSSLDGLVEMLQQVAAAAPSTPLYYYHIPRLSGVKRRMIELLARAKEELPTFAGIKFSSFELDDLVQCVHFDGGRYNILFGSDEMLLAGLSMGAAGAVGSTYNFMGPHYRAVIDAFEDGRIQGAQKAQLHATRMVHRVLEEGGGGAIKAAMSILGVDCGPPRLPIESVSEDRMRELQKDLESMAKGERGGPRIA